MDSIETQVVVAIVTVIINVVVATVISSYVKKGEKEDARINTLWDLHNENKKDSEKIDKLIEKIDGLKSGYNSLDSHVRHEIANMRTSVNGFGERLLGIEEEAKNRDRLGHELKGKVELLEKFILDKR